MHSASRLTGLGCDTVYVYLGVPPSAGRAYSLFTCCLRRLQWSYLVPTLTYVTRSVVHGSKNSNTGLLWAMALGNPITTCNIIPHLQLVWAW